MGAGHGLPVEDADEAEPALVVWRPPAWPTGAKPIAHLAPPIVAGRCFAAGELLEKSYCLELGPRELESSYLGSFCLQPSSPGDPKCAKLFPMNWGLVLLSGRGRANAPSQPNLACELFREPPPEPPGEMARLNTYGDDVPADCYWLSFYAQRSIAEGEELVAWLPPGWCQRSQGSLFQAALETLGAHAKWTSCDEEDDDADDCFTLDFDESGSAPKAIRLPENPPVVVASSSIHGVGMFAQRDLRRGDLLEIAPALPVLDVDVHADDVFGNYVFESKFQPGSQGGVSMMQLGGGAIYNHSEDHIVGDHSFEDCPFIRRWYALEDVASGSELFSSYGDDYWKTRGCTPVPVRPKGPWWRAGLC